MKKMFKAYYHSEIGEIEVTGTEVGIISVDFTDEKFSENSELHPCLKECIAQIDQYFKGKRKDFSVNILMQGTDFQKKVWKQLTKIPFGKKVSYRDISTAIGNKNACRAVGSANAKNPVSIIVPCHRVIGNDGKLTGYGGGIWRKDWLLKHEAKVCSST